MSCVSEAAGPCHGPGIPEPPRRGELGFTLTPTGVGEGSEIAQAKERLDAVGQQLEQVFERWQQLEEIDTAAGQAAERLVTGGRLVDAVAALRPQNVTGSTSVCCVHRSNALLQTDCAASMTTQRLHRRSK